MTDFTDFDSYENLQPKFDQAMRWRDRWMKATGVFIESNEEFENWIKNAASGPITDLDREIRDHLYLYFETGDPESEQQKATDALHAVLTYLETVKLADDRHRVGAEIVAHGVRYTIARELGVSDV